MRTDIHTHVFHPKIAARVLDQLNGHYDIPPQGSGLLDDLLDRARAAGLERVVVHNAATDAHQVRPANAWALGLAAQPTRPGDPEVVAFGTMHPDFPEIEKELDRLAAHGVPGLKFHCDFQGFFMDDPRLAAILEAAADRFVIMFHVGDRLPPEQNPSCPRKLAALAKAFPNTPMIAAHFGGYLHWREALEHLAGSRVYIDTSSSIGIIDPALAKAIYAAHPRERILFGSDYPLYDPGPTLTALQRTLELGDAELEFLTHTADGLLGPARAATHMDTPTGT